MAEARWCVGCVVYCAAQYRALTHCQTIALTTCNVLDGDGVRIRS